MRFPRRQFFSVSAGLLLALVTLPAQQQSRPTGKTPSPPAEGRLRAGDPAPDFELPLRGSQQTLRLASFRGHKPVALVFGSYT